MGAVAALGEGATIAIAGGLVKTGAMLGLSAASAALMRPNTPSSGSTLDFKPDPKAPVRGAMGYTALGGNKVFQATWGYKRVAMSLGVALSLGPIDQTPRFEADGATVSFTGPQNEATGFYAADMWQRTTLGLPTDTALLPPTGLKYGTPGLTGWGSQHAAPQVAFSFWTMVLAKNPEDRDVFTNGVPEPRWIGRWMKVWDPRKDSTYPGGNGPQRRDDWRTWGWSENPYVHALAWVRGHHKLNADGTVDRTKRIAGVGAPDAAVDIPAFVEGMNVADANGWAISGEWSTSDGKFQTLLAMLQAGGGEPISRGAQISVMVNAPRVATYTYTRDDLIGQAEVRPLTPRRERKNTIIPRYKSEANGWQYVPAGEVTSSVYRDEDRGEPRTLEIEYTHVRIARQAGQLAAYALANLREGLTVTLPSKAHLMHVHGGDCIEVDVPELALAAQKFIVRRATVNHQAASVTLELRSESDGKHPWALGQAAQPAPSPALSAVDPKYVPPPAPDEWTVAPMPPAGGVSQPVIVVDLPLDTTDIVAVIIKHGPSATGPWTHGYEGAPSADGRYQIAGLIPGQSYCVSLQYVTKNGATSDPDIKCGIVAGDLVAQDIIPTAPSRLALDERIDDAFGATAAVAGDLAAAELVVEATQAELVAARQGSPNLLANITGIKTTVETEAMTRASEISRVEAKTGIRNNLVPNSTGVRGGAGWVLSGGWFAGDLGWAWGHGFKITTPGTAYMYTDPAALIEWPANTKGVLSFDALMLGRTAGRLRVYVQWHTPTGTLTSDFVYIEADRDFGERLSMEVESPPTTTHAYIVANTEDFAGSQVAIRQIKLERGLLPATAWTDDATEASVASAVTMHSQAIDLIETKMSLAEWGVLTEAVGGEPAVIGVVSSSLGSYVAIDAPQIYWGPFTVFDRDTRTLQRIVDGKRFVLGLGLPFGANGNLREWWGPDGIALSSMSHLNGYNGRMTVAPYVFDNVSGQSFAVKCSHTVVAASRVGAGIVTSPVVTFEVAGAVGPVQFDVYLMNGDGSITAVNPSASDTSAPFQHQTVFSTSVTVTQIKTARFICSARDANGNTGTAVVAVSLRENT